MTHSHRRHSSSQSHCHLVVMYSHLPIIYSTLRILEPYSYSEKTKSIQFLTIPKQRVVHIWLFDIVLALKQLNFARQMTRNLIPLMIKYKLYTSRLQVIITLTFYIIFDTGKLNEKVQQASDNIRLNYYHLKS